VDFFNAIQDGSYVPKYHVQADLSKKDEIAKEVNDEPKGEEGITVSQLAVEIVSKFTSDVSTASPSSDASTESSSSSSSSSPSTSTTPLPMAKGDPIPEPGESIVTPSFYLSFLSALHSLSPTVLASNLYSTTTTSETLVVEENVSPSPSSSLTTATLVTNEKLETTIVENVNVAEVAKLDEENRS
jgi:hypothetical protein